MNGDGQETDGLTESTESTPVLSGSVFGRAYSQLNIPNALSLLVKPGKDYRDLLMRSFIASNLSKLNFAWLAGFVSCVEDARAFGDKEFEEKLLDLLAGMVSLEGLGRSQMVEAIIGHYRQRTLEQGGEGFFDKFKSAAGFSQKKQEE